MTDPQTTADDLGSDRVSRTIGMVLGGIGGAFFLIILDRQTPISADWVLALPGVGVTLGCGLFSFRRTKAWGYVSAALGLLCMFFVLWLRFPDEIGLFELPWALITTPVGLVHIVLVCASGYVGAGWRKPERPDEEEEEDEEEEDD